MYFLKAQQPMFSIFFQAKNILEYKYVFNWIKIIANQTTFIFSASSADEFTDHPFHLHEDEDSCSLDAELQVLLEDFCYQTCPWQGLPSALYSL